MVLASCTAKSIKPICQIEVSLEHVASEQIVKIFENVANSLGIDFVGYDRDFPSGTNITVASLSVSSGPAATVMDMTDQEGVYLVSFYKVDDKDILMQITTLLKNAWGDKFMVPEICEELGT